MTDPSIIEAATQALACLPGNDELHRDLAMRVLTAVIPLIEADALERAAKVAEEYVCLSNRAVAAEIRALKEKP